MKQILIIAMIVLLIGNVIALNETGSINIKPIQKLCKINYEIDKATEQVTIMQKIQVMENKIIVKNVADNEKYKIDITNYNNNLKDYNSKLGKSNEVRPTFPKLSYKEITITAKIPKVENKTTYFIDWVNFKIGSKTIQSPVYETKEVAKKQIKQGFNFNSDTGEFYKMEKC